MWCQMLCKREWFWNINTNKTCYIKQSWLICVCELQNIKIKGVTSMFSSFSVFVYSTDQPWSHVSSLCWSRKNGCENIWGAVNYFCWCHSGFGFNGLFCSFIYFKCLPRLSSIHTCLPCIHPFRLSSIQVCTQGSNRQGNSIVFL